MDSGLQQRQLWQHAWEAFFLNGQCSWINWTKHIHLRFKSSLHFPGCQQHFFGLGGQTVHTACGEGRTGDPVGWDQ